VNRDTAINAIESRQRPYDMLVIGGGATGAGIALDAASRQLDVLLLEGSDFGAGTSSRSTKIIHGGVRYLPQGRIGLVREALRERKILLRNAPHIVRPLAFVVPIENAWERAKYYAGLKLYDLLAGGDSLDACSWVPQRELARTLTGVDSARLSGAMRYFDGQFDDTRLLIDILATAVAHGATVLNYAPVIGFLKDPGDQVRGVTCRDTETGRSYEIEARIVVNATGPASDGLLRLDNSARDNTIMPSQGAHIVVDKSFLPGDDALLMPRTPDGRVMFAIPWLGHVLIGTTDTPVSGDPDEPVPLREEINLILETAGRYLTRTPGRDDILSTFAGIRPLVRAPGAASTAQVSREHRIDVLPSGLLSISGGKWTTYRLMAEQCVDTAARQAGWDIDASPTASLPLNPPENGRGDSLRYACYGGDATELLRLERTTPGLDERLVRALDYRRVECLWAIRHEMARRIEDILARRTRALFLNAAAACEAAPVVAQMLADELDLDEHTISEQMKSFTRLTSDYLAADTRED